MITRVIRPAEAGDIGALVEFCKQYTEKTYRGFAALEKMPWPCDGDCETTFEKWLETPDVRISIMTVDEILRGYSVFHQVEPAEAGKKQDGEIIRLEILAGTNVQDSRALVGHTIEELSKMGSSQVKVWVLRDNLRVRFNYEQYGFKPDGCTKQVMMEDEPFSWTQYVYRVSGLAR